MKKIILLTLSLAATFGLSFAVKTFTTHKNHTTMKRVTGIGGVFFKCQNPAKMNDWYKTHLGLNTNPMEHLCRKHQILCAIGQRLYDKLPGRKSGSTGRATENRRRNYRRYHRELRLRQICTHHGPGGKQDRTMGAG